jgi:GDP/UDP-N,N'-diacetylbacillosamine 2-epimerase (hydrolysing)
MPPRTICVVTGSRAEYGLLRWVMEGIRSEPALRLQIIATASHLSSKFGSTYEEIERDGFSIDRKVEMGVGSDTAVGVTASVGRGIAGFGEALSELQPALMLVLGDRFEVFAAAAAATIARVPVAHAHGGEASEGAFDEPIRHAVTKMAHLHFVAAEEYRRRVIQLGEHPDRVFLVGGLGVDSINNLPVLDRSGLEAELGCALGAKSLLITFHPVTLEAQTSARHMTELLAALAGLGDDVRLIFTMPNADPDHDVLRAMTQAFVASHPNARAYTSLGQRLYLSCLRHVDGVVGNSSSGIIEAPALHKGTVNIGDRQRGRLKASSVIDCAPDRGSIAAALDELFSPQFQARLSTIRSRYGEGGASKKIVAVLRDWPLENLLKKSFYDLDVCEVHQRD